ncbi:MAG: energy transducer TonB [Candidatus Omnitrophica bacterium]|nr:energy transducer TonB [Candidatus Omnitrophota bacterium]
MNSNLVKSALISIGAHAIFFVPLAAMRGVHERPQAQVMPGLSSVEMEWVSPSRSSEEGFETAQEPLPPMEEWMEDPGALSGSWLPQTLLNPAPVYPRIARLQGWEGTVLIQAWVTPVGSVGAARVAESSGREPLDGAALAAVRQWRFRAARDGARAVASRVEVPVTFRLKERTD